MHVFDASAIIHAWDNYPIENFPPLWDWIAERIHSDEFATPIVVLEEVEQKTTECGGWLKEQDIRVVPLTGEVMQHALNFKHAIGVTEDNYHVKG